MLFKSTNHNGNFKSLGVVVKVCKLLKNGLKSYRLDDKKRRTLLLELPTKKSLSFIKLACLSPNLSPFLSLILLSLFHLSPSPLYLVISLSLSLYLSFSFSFSSSTSSSFSFSHSLFCFLWSHRKNPWYVSSHIKQIENVQVRITSTWYVCGSSHPPR